MPKGTMFSTLSGHLGKKEPGPAPSQLVCDHIALLSIKFEHYFPNASDQRIAKEWVRDPFANVPKKSSMSVHEERQLIEIANDSEKYVSDILPCRLLD